MLRLKSLYLRNFRNFSEAEITFREGCNVIQGENGQGKTNLLEAIILLSTGRSWRTIHLSDLIREHEGAFFLEAEVDRDAISHLIRLQFDGQTKKLQIDSNIHSHFNPLLGLLPSVLYAPQGSEIIAGAPAERRKFIDLQLAQSDPLYIYHLVRYHRAMKQRNALLRQNRLDGIECWESEMTQAASYLRAARQQLISSLQPLLAVEAKTLSQEREEHTLTFRSTYPAATEKHLEELKNNRRKDQEREQTTIGPHRDDLHFVINEKPIRLFASEGQKRTTLAALKIAEWRHLATKIDASPLFAIDDLSHSLDEKREGSFCQILASLGQVFITTPYDLSLPFETHKITIQNGSSAQRVSAK